MSEVVTGEAVVLELPVASFPGRLLALTVDLIIQAVLGGLAVIGILLTIGQLNGDYIAAAVIGVYLAVTVVYPTLWETMTRGKTPGKMALGLRVVGDDGSPERFRQALVRSLVGLFEIYSFAPAALITSIVSAKGKRLGDIFAGTYVLQERMPARAPLPPVFTVVPPPLILWAQSLQISQLSDRTAEDAGSYLRRYYELAPQARDVLGVQLANAVAAEVSPPPPFGTPPTAYLAAVLAVRRDRDAARTGWTASAGPSTPPPPLLVPQPQASPPPPSPQPQASPLAPFPQPQASPPPPSPQPQASPPPPSPQPQASPPSGSGAPPRLPVADSPPGFAPPA
jgi:uncharacterized RDD family membrane protein YckC